MSKKYNLDPNLATRYDRFTDEEVADMRAQALEFSDPMPLNSPLRDTLHVFALEAAAELRQRRDWRAGNVEGDLDHQASKVYAACPPA